jgi:hypothetical protein
MSCPLDSASIKIGFDVSNVHGERHDQPQSDGSKRVSLLSKALANPSVAVMQLDDYSDSFSDTDDDGESSDGDSSEIQSSGSVSSPIPIQCSHSRVAAGFAVARWQLRQQQRHFDEGMVGQNGHSRQERASRRGANRS